jgi:ribonuclease P protein component
VALNRALRLRKSSDFQRVRQQRRSVASRLLILAWAPNTVNTLRIGFVISKRISKRAVERNHIKRLLSEAIRPMIPDLPAAGWDIVISGRNQVIGSDLTILKQDLATLLRRARLLVSASSSETNK